MGQKKLFMSILLFTLVLIGSSFAFAVDTLPIVVRPLVNGTIQPSTSFAYIFNFTTDGSCSNVLLSRSATIITDPYGIGSTEIDVLPLLTSEVPLYLCEYRDGILRQTHNIGYSINKATREQYLNSDFYCDNTTCYTLDEIYNHIQNISQLNNDVGYITNSTMNKSIDSNNIIFNDGISMDTFKYSLSTGVLQGGQITINPDNVSIDIASATSLYVDMADINNPVVEILYLNATTINAGLSLSIPIKWIGISRVSEGVGTITLSPSFSPLDKRTITILGRVWGIGTSNIEGVGQYTTPAFYSTSTMIDLINTLGALNREGNVFTPTPDGMMKLDKSAGRSFRFSANFLGSPESPNIQNDNILLNISSYHYHLYNQSWTILTSTIDPDYYDLNGVRTAIPSGNFTIQRLYYYPVSQRIDIIYGQHYYSTFAEAKLNIQIESMQIDSLNQANLEGSILRAYIITKQGTTNLTNSSDALIISATNLGSGGGLGAISSISNHNLLFGLQGGNIGLNDYYHLSFYDYSNVINQVWNLTNTTANIQSLGFNTTSQLDNRYIQNNTNVNFTIIYLGNGGRITANATCSYLFYDNNEVLRDAIC